MRDNEGRGRGNRWRTAVWSAASLLLLAPLAAMQVTDEVDWDRADFALAGALVLAAGFACELAARTTGSGAYRAAVAVALATALILVWMNLAVGIIGTEDDPANLMYAGVLAVGILGAGFGRLRPPGMARALAATALAQAAVAVGAVAAGWGHPASPPLELALLNGGFAALWLASAWLFRKAARERGVT